MKSTIVEHTVSGNKKARWCIRCGMHVNEQNEIDLDFYTARQYLKLMQIPEEQRCKHQSPAPTLTNKELLIEVGNVSMSPDMRLLLNAIVRRLP